MKETTYLPSVRTSKHGRYGILIGSLVVFFTVLFYLYDLCFDRRWFREWIRSIRNIPECPKCKSRLYVGWTDFRGPGRYQCQGMPPDDHELQVPFFGL